MIKPNESVKFSDGSVQTTKHKINSIIKAMGPVRRGVGWLGGGGGGIEFILAN